MNSSFNTNCRDCSSVRRWGLVNTLHSNWYLPRECDLNHSLLYLHNVHLEPFVKVFYPFTETESKSSEAKPQNKGSHQ